MITNSNDFILQLVVKENCTLCNFLANHCDLSRMRIKDSLNKGAAILHRPHSKKRRVRKAKFKLLPGDAIYFSYSKKILQLIPPKPVLVHEEFHYSIWFKPVSMLTQGTQYGDHCSLIRYIEQYNNHRRDIKVVHRLDRDASGIILFAHTLLAAGAGQFYKARQHALRQGDRKNAHLITHYAISFIGIALFFLFLSALTNKYLWIYLAIGCSFSTQLGRKDSS